MPDILILYSTTDGHTTEICRRIGSVLAQNEHRVEIHAIDDPSGVDIDAFDKIVIGASIRYGKHRKPVYDFIADHQPTLAAKPSAFFSVSVVARKPNRNRPDTNPYVRRFLRRISWQPRQVGVFAGKIDYPRYGFLDRWMIRLIMYMTHGPTDLSAVVVFTDWNQVEDFARVVAEM